MGKFVVFILTVFITLTQLDAASFQSDVQRIQSPLIRLNYGGIEDVNENVTIDYKNVLKTLIPRYMEEYANWEFQPRLVNEILSLWTVSNDCKGHLIEWMYWIDQTINKTNNDWIKDEEKAWILHMIDAWGKLPEGVLSGHINALGDYDECTQLRADKVVYTPNPDINVPSKFRGRYCNIIFGPRPPSQNTTKKAEARISLSLVKFLELLSLGEGVLFYPSLATCFPSTCSYQDVENIFQSLFVAEKTFYPSIYACYTDEKPDFDSADYGVMVMLAIMGGLIFLGTAIDISMSGRKPNPENPPRKPGVGVQSLLAFSLKTNIRKILNSKTGPGDFRCLHGLRFLSTMWVVAAHTWYVTTFIPMWNMVDVKTTHKDWTILMMINSHVSVDTFFVMSGLLITYNVLKMLDKTNGKLNIPMFYIHRYLRLTPTYAILIGVMATLWPYFGSGPYWKIMDNWSQFCRTNWWTNLLYVNNLVHPKEMCYGEAWYLANDMQFYVLSPLLIFPLWKWPIFGKILLGGVTVGSVLSPRLLVHFLDSTPGTIATRNMGDWFYSVNIVPWARAQTYCVGIWMGYILYRTKGVKKEMPLLIQVAGWIFVMFSAWATLYSIYPYFDPNEEIPDEVSFLYASCNKFIWGLGVSWVMFACIHGHGGMVNTFLSWRAFVPLGRLTFSVYLISLHLQMILHLGFRQAITYDQYTMTNLFFAHAVMALLLGFVCTVTVESPFIQLEKLILPAGGGGSQPRVKRPAKRYGIFYNSQEVIFNSFDVKDDDISDNTSNNKGETEKPEV